MKKIDKAFDVLINHSIFIVIAVLTVAASFTDASFWHDAPLSLLNKTASTMILALGMGCVMLIGGVDLSAGRIMGLTSLVAASLLQTMEAKHKIFPGMEAWPIFAVLFLVIVIGGIIGAFNGFFVGKFRLHPFIVTLTTKLMLYGLMLIYLGWGTNRGMNIEKHIDEYTKLITNTVNIGSWQIPNHVWYSILIVLFVWVIWKFTGFGKKMRLYGGNREAAKSLNINPLIITVGAFAMAGMLFGVDGFINAARSGGPGASAGSNAEFDAIAACLIGGVSGMGGIGKVGGIVLGVVFVQLFAVCLQWLSVSANIAYILKGALVLWAVIIDARRHYN